MVESATSPAAGAGVERPDGALVPQPPAPDPLAQLDLFLARLAADGLWLFEATRPGRPLAPEVKQALISRIAASSPNRPPTHPARPVSTRKP